MEVTSNTIIVLNHFPSAIWLCLEHHVFKYHVIWFSAVLSVKWDLTFV